jgi:hypothetical protein
MIVSAGGQKKFDSELIAQIAMLTKLGRTAKENFAKRYDEVNENDLVDLNGMFAEGKLEDLKGDPKIWFIDLEWWWFIGLLLRHKIKSYHHFWSRATLIDMPERMIP